MEVMTLLPPVTGNELQDTKVPPAVRPIESSAVPSSIEYVNRGVWANSFATIRLPALGFGSIDAGARKALAGASKGEVAGTCITSLGSCDAGFNPDAARFRVWLDGLAATCLALARLRFCASANGIAHTVTSRSR